MESIKTKQSELSGLLPPNKNVSQKNKNAKEEHHINVLIIIFETEFHFKSSSEGDFTVVCSH